MGHSGVLVWLLQAPGEDSGPGSMLQSQPARVLRPNFNPGTVAETKQVGHCVTLWDLQGHSCCFWDSTGGCRARRERAVPCSEHSASPAGTNPATATHWSRRTKRASPISSPRLLFFFKGTLLVRDPLALGLEWGRTGSPAAFQLSSPGRISDPEQTPPASEEQRDRGHLGRQRLSETQDLSPVLGGWTSPCTCCGSYAHSCPCASGQLVTSPRGKV